MINPPVQPLVSVVIPCYRQAHFLGTAIESLLAQTHPSYEIIVVDDGSPDDVASVVARFPGVILCRQDNAGLSQARNAGLARCSGEFVVFLDADDRLLPNALRDGVRAHSEYPGCAFVWGFNRPIDESGNPLPSEPRVFSGPAEYQQLLRENVVGPPLGVMFRREMVAAVGGFSTAVRCTEDYGLYLRLARSYPSWCHGTLIAEYRFHTANMSSNLDQMLEGVLGVLDQQEEWVRGDVRLRRALREGRRRAWQTYDGGRRLRQLSERARAGRWGPATVCALALLTRYPRLFAPILYRRMKRLVLLRV